MQTGTVLPPPSLILSALLVLAGVCSDVRPAFAQTPLDCPLPADVAPPAPRATAQQVEDGSPSLMNFTLAARDQRVPDQSFSDGVVLPEGKGSWPGRTSPATNTPATNTPATSTKRRPSQRRQSRAAGK